MLLPIQFAAGGLALVLGAVALLAKKGETIHRRSGLLFVCAMLVMGISAAILGNVGGGLMTVYFVGTALTTVRPVSAWTRTFNVAALMVHDPGGGWRRPHHAIRRASWRAAPGAPFVADVLRAVHRGRIVRLDP